MAKRSLSETEEQKYYDDDEDDDEEDEEEENGEESDDEEEVDNGENEEEEEEEEVGERRRARLVIRFSSDHSKGLSSSKSRVCCQVSHCGQDLGEAKMYYRRHKVCEYHAKAVFVSIDGNDQRFCQQCSRFHEISEFDDTKRSCRKRLAGHNERRRKQCVDLQAEEEAVHIASVSDVKDKSWRVRGHLEHLTTRVQGKPCYKHYQFM